MAHEINYDFEELQTAEFGLGAMFCGTAELIECGDSFRVENIRLGWRNREGKFVDGSWIDRCPYDGPSTFHHHLFKTLAAILQADPDVQRKWDESMDELLHDRSEPVRYSALTTEPRERQTAVE